MLGNQCLSEWDALLLRVEVVRYNLVHASLLEIYSTGLRNDEVGVYFFLCLIESVRKDGTYGACWDFGYLTILVSGLCLCTVHGTHNGVAAGLVVTDYEQLQRLAYGLCLTVLICFRFFFSSKIHSLTVVS